MWKNGFQYIQKFGTMRKSYRILIMFFLLFCATYKIFPQEESDIINIDSICLYHNPCLYWDDTTKASTILAYYQDIYHRHSQITKEACLIRDSLKNKVSNWGDQLFETKLWNYECLNDLFYEIYLLESRESTLRFFKNLKDTIKIEMKFNEVFINKKYDIYYIVIDSTNRITGKYNAFCHMDFFTIPLIEKKSFAYAFLKYKGCFYQLGCFFGGGDVLRIDIYSRKQNGQMSGKIKVVHIKNWALFEQNFLKRNRYSHSNKKILQSRIGTFFTMDTTTN